MEEINAQLSLYRPDSGTVPALNAGAGKAHEVEEHLRAILELALRLWSDQAAGLSCDRGPSGEFVGVQRGTKPTRMIAPIVSRRRSSEWVTPRST